MIGYKYAMHFLFVFLHVCKFKSLCPFQYCCSCNHYGMHQQVPLCIWDLSVHQPSNHSRPLRVRVIIIRPAADTLKPLVGVCKYLAQLISAVRNNNVTWWCYLVSNKEVFFSHVFHYPFLLFSLCLLSFLPVTFLLVPQGLQGLGQYSFFVCT